MAGESVMLGGLRTARVDRQGLALRMLEDCRAAHRNGQAPQLVFSANGHSVALNARDPEFARLMERANLIHADGMSVVFASLLFTQAPLPERIATTDFFHDAAAMASAQGLGFFLLGGEEAVNAAAFEAVRARYPSLRLSGRRHGYFDASEEADLCHEIVAAGTDVLWVGLGRPDQESFAVRNRDRLQGIGWIKTCGGLFGYLAGREKRAPLWMQRAGLEWLHRAARDPRRLAGRYLATNLTALWRLARYSEGRQRR